MKSIIKMLGTDQFKRIRVVLAVQQMGCLFRTMFYKIFKEEMIIMEKVIEHSARAVESFIESSRFDHVMNEFNGEVK